MKSLDSKMKVSTVLIVDDEPTFREMLSSFVSRNGYQTVCAENSKEALAVLEKQSVDAVLLDIQLGTELGFNLLPVIREKHAVPVIMVTGLGYEEEIMQEALKAGAAGYVSKVVPLNEVTVALRRAMRRQTEPSAT